MMKKLGLMAAVLVCVVGVACTEQSTSENTVKSTAPVLKVAVFADGRITADGSLTTIESLRESLKRLAELQGTVWYYREAGHAEPTPRDDGHAGSCRQSSPNQAVDETGLFGRRRSGRKARWQVNDEYHVVPPHSHKGAAAEPGSLGAQIGWATKSTIHRNLRAACIYI